MSLFIPIIGSISSGKSTFLKGLLGINELETGATTTTKFICLIKNSSKTSFYHVILKKQGNNVSIQKEGETIENISEIKKKIEELNKKFDIKKGTKDEIFYMMERPIKNFNNKEILDSCIFMDIPGLNEKKSTYLEDIFSIITLNNILFQIVIFDSQYLEQDNMINILKELDNKRCLKKEGNLYILNKIDCITTGGENIIEHFKQYFYRNFEKKNSSNIYINIYKNHFIPMNSLLFLAETNVVNDFYSWLVIELFYYLQTIQNMQTPNENLSSYFNYLEERLKYIINQNNLDSNKIESESNEIKKDNQQMEKIITSVNNLQELLSVLEKSPNFSFGIKIEKPKIKKVMIQLYVIHKNKMASNPIYSEFYQDLNNIIMNINKPKEDLESPPPASNKIITTKSDTVLQEMKEFLRVKLKNRFEQLNSYLQIIQENLLGRKIRLSFIGPISVGKSSVLNCIIGQNILPSNKTECTYRGIIIKHADIDDFLLYKTSLETFGSGLEEFNNFKEDIKPFCKGKSDIYDYLNNKNNDRQFDKNDAFITIKGRLKIFDYIKLDQELIDKIEFIRLPVHDRKDNEFNKTYYHKILKFTNSCIYINAAKAIEDMESDYKIKAQYMYDKSKLFPTLQPRFIDSCLFLINKSDEIYKVDERNKIKNKLINIITEIEPLAKNDINKINISFFSAKSFMEYLEYYNLYVSNLEKNPYLTLDYLYTLWKKNKFYFFGLKKYIIDSIADKIEDKFEEEIPELAPTSTFYSKLKEGLNSLRQAKNFNGLTKEDEEEIIKKLYGINQLLKNTDFSKTKYSKTFFDKIKQVIINSEKLQKENFKRNFEAFFKSSDILFDEEMRKERQIVIQKSKEQFEFFNKILIPEVEKVLIQKENIIKNIINSGKDKCLSLINKEMEYYEKYLEENKYDLNKTFSVFEGKLKNIIEDMQKEQENEAKTIIEDIKKKANEVIKSYYKSQNLPVQEILEKIKETNNLFDIMFFSVLGVIAVNLGVSLGVAFLGGFAVGLGLDILFSIGAVLATGFGILGGIVLGGIFFTVSWLFGNYKKRKQYRESLEKTKENLINKFNDITYSFSDHYKTFKDALIKELKLKVEVFLKDTEMNEDEMKEAKKEYEAIKERTMKLIKEKYM